MENLQLLSLFISALIWLVIAIAACWIIYRIVTVVLLKRPRSTWKQVPGQAYIKGLKIISAVSYSLLLISLPFYVWIASGARRFMPDYLTVILLGVLMIWAGMELYLSFSISEKLRQKTYKKIALTLAVVMLAPAACYYALSVPAIFSYPGKKESYVLDLPVKNEWTAGHAGGTERVNYHCALRAQKYAIDISRVNAEGAFYKGEGSKVEDFYTANEPIYAPAAGTVVRVVDSFDNTGIMDERKVKTNPAGNHVVIEIGKDRYLFLAHLSRGSISVKEGDRVSSGNMIGRAGNSGNTSWPHLHMHIQDMPVVDNRNATAYPFYFRGLERKRWLSWQKIAVGYLLRNDLFRPAAAH